MEEDLAQKAIQAAISGNWELAEKLNRQILKDTPHDVEALNRLARASGELGRIKEAQKAYQKVLSLDRFNTIATRGLERLKVRKAREKIIPQTVETHFLEEPGKTKTVSLIHLGGEKVLAQLNTGEEVRLVPGSHRISVQTVGSLYIGRLPDDLSARLLKLIRGGNNYQALVKSAEPGQVRIFLREVARAKEFANLSSFPETQKPGYVAFTPPDLVHDEPPQVTSLEEEQET